MKTVRHAMLLMMIAVSPAAAQTKAPPPHAVHPAFLNYKDLKWEKLRPEQGEASAEIAILHVNPQSGATQLFIRSPKNDYAPRHWHTANETHTVIYGRSAPRSASTTRRRPLPAAAGPASRFDRSEPAQFGLIPAALASAPVVPISART